MAADASALERALRERARGWCDELATGVRDEARSRASRRTGELHDSIIAEPAQESGNTFTARVAAEAEHAKYQDEGTGVYGPEGQRIQGNPLLAFDWPAAGGLVIVHSVSGSPGTHFWEEALKQFPNIVRSL